MMRLGFAPRIAVISALILGCGIVATGILSLHKYESTLSDFLASRFEFVVNDIRQNIEAQLDLGLSLEDMQDEVQRLNAIMSADEQILSIEVFDTKGFVLFSTDPSFVGDLVTENWVDAGRVGSDRAVWRILETDAGVVGALLRNNLGQHVGSLALRYSREFLDGSVSNQFSRLSLIILMVLLGIITISIYGTIFLLRSQHRAQEGLRNAIDDVVNSCRDGEALAWAKTEYPDLAAFADSVFVSHDEIDSALQEIRKLDKEGEK